MKDRTAETFDSAIQLRKFSPFCLGTRDAAFGLALTHWCPQPSQTLTSTPPSSTALSLSFLLSLTLTQWAISVAGGFYLCSQARCRHGEGLLCSRGLCTWKSVCNQEVTSETGATRKPFLTFQTRTEVRGLSEYQSRCTVQKKCLCLRETRSCSSQTPLQIEQAPAHRYKTTDSQMNLYEQTCQLLQKINQRLNSRQALLYLSAYACKWA